MKKAASRCMALGWHCDVDGGLQNILTLLLPPCPLPWGSQNPRRSLGSLAKADFLRGGKGNALELETSVLYSVPLLLARILLGRSDLCVSVSSFVKQWDWRATDRLIFRVLGTHGVI